MRRAFWFEEATGRSQWEPPFPAPGYGYEGSRIVPPPESYYAPPAGPPPGFQGQRGGYYQQQREEHRRSNVGKYLAAGAAGLALGGLAGAVMEHEQG